MLLTPFKALMIVFLLTLAAVAATGQIHSASEPIEIRGQVRFSRGGAPADNVIVRLEAVSGGSN